ncbi:hypothetical protein HPB50_025920 [Hyalomma asiaticum]|uniref:Uncharacterized protein n=1 Tax=Hyalomma asiaticum TaxID=266040 RepID=A0ACB7TNF5_HYAAI|nr:hypothetical protein HPB50_025920 [Hyalomma asiaticum]
MAMLQMQLRITEMELAMERLRNENGPRAAAAVQSIEADRSEDRRLTYTSLLKDVLLPMPTQESLIPSRFDDVEATFDCYDVPAKIMFPLEIAESAESFEESRRGMTNSSEVARGERPKLISVARKAPPGARKTRTLLISRLTPSEPQRLQQLLHDTELGDRTPSQLLRHMRQLLHTAGATTTDADSRLLRELFLQRLPVNVRMVLASAADKRLSQFAELAESVPAVAPPSVAALQPDISGRAPTTALHDIREQISRFADTVAAMQARSTLEERQRPAAQQRKLVSQEAWQRCSQMHPSLRPCGKRERPALRTTIVWGWRLPGDSHKQTPVGGGMRWPTWIADCFGEVCLQVRPRAQVAMVAGTFPSTPRTYVVRERTATTTRTAAVASSPTSSGPRFLTWGARYSEQPRWRATTTVVRVNELMLKIPLAESEHNPYIGVLRRDSRGGRGDDPENAPSAHREQTGKAFKGQRTLDIYTVQAHQGGSSF